MKLDRENTLKFVFAGSMPQLYLDAIQQIRPKLDNVEILGYIWGEDKVRFYSSISFLYFPTLREGFGLPILESFQTVTIPIVHSDSEIPQELKKHCDIIEKTDQIFNLIQTYEENVSLLKEKLVSNSLIVEKFSYNGYADFFVKYVQRTKNTI